jgi:hypothetical protein
MKRSLTIRKWSLPIFLAFWMLFGGSLFWRGFVPAALAISILGLGSWALAALRSGQRPVLMKPALALALAFPISIAGNLDIFPQTLGGLPLLLFGLAALAVGACLGEERLIEGFFWAGWIWLALWPVPRLWGWVDNRNLLAVWPVVSALVILTSGKPWWWALPHLGVLILLGSRGAILGLCLGVIVWRRPRINARQTILFAAVGLAFLWTLTAYRPREAIYRFSYWIQAIEAVAEHNPWIGLGPGGVYARHTILEPNDPLGMSPYFHMHAHNLFIQVLAELGLIGIAALGVAAYGVARVHPQGRWQIVVLAALLVHSMVDLPLYFPGPLLAFMLIAGSVGARRSGLQPVTSNRPAVHLRHGDPQ